MPKFLVSTFLFSCSLVPKAGLEKKQYRTKLMSFKRYFTVSKIRQILGDANQTNVFSKAMSMEKALGKINTKQQCRRLRYLLPSD
jgi:hypothetical protein